MVYGFVLFFHYKGWIFETEEEKGYSGECTRQTKDINKINLIFLK